jgi:hypothetical protein
MLEEAEIALARAELPVIEARGRLADQLATIDRLKGRGENALEAEQPLGLFEAYLSDTEFSFCVANTHPRPSSLGMTRPNRAAVIVNAKR